jgi:hypothetical protein
MHKHSMLTTREGAEMGSSRVDTAQLGHWLRQLEGFDVELATTGHAVGRKKLLELARRGCLLMIQSGVNRELRRDGREGRRWAEKEERLARIADMRRAIEERPSDADFVTFYQEIDSGVRGRDCRTRYGNCGKWMPSWTKRRRKCNSRTGCSSALVEADVRYRPPRSALLESGRHPSAKC